MLVEKIQALCKRKNITLARLEKDLNFGNRTIRRWDSSSPSIDKVMEVANYFKVSVDSLLKKLEKRD